jgi:hypothetical protein
MVGSETDRERRERGRRRRREGEGEGEREKKRGKEREKEREGEGERKKEKERRQRIHFAEKTRNAHTRCKLRPGIKEPCNINRLHRKYSNATNYNKCKDFSKAVTRQTYNIRKQALGAKRM